MDIFQFLPLYLSSPRGVIAIVLDSSSELNKCEIQSYHYVHFQTNIDVKGMNLRPSCILCSWQKA